MRALALVCLTATLLVFIAGAIADTSVLVEKPLFTKALTDNTPLSSPTVGSSSPTCFELPAFNKTDVLLRTAKVFLSTVEVCSTLNRRSECKTLAFNNKTANGHRLGNSVYVDANYRLCLNSLAEQLVLLNEERPLDKNMIRTVSARTHEWNEGMLKFMQDRQRENHNDATSDDITYRVQVAYKFYEQNARLRGLRTHKVVRKLLVPSDIRTVQPQFARIGGDTYHTDAAPNKHAVVVMMVNKQFDDDNDNCDDENDSDCDFIVVSRATPAWVFAILFILLAVAAAILICVLLTSPTAVWAPETHEIHVTSSPSHRHY